MEVNQSNPFYESAINHMAVQLNELETLINRKLTPSEKDNLHEFYLGLSTDIKDQFESSVGRLL